MRPIEEHLHYDFNYQQTTRLTEEIAVLPVSCLCV